MSWYLRKGEDTQGPFSEDQVAQWINAGDLGPDCWMWSEGMPDWVPVPQPEAPQGPPPMPSPVQPTNPAAPTYNSPVSPAPAPPAQTAQVAQQPSHQHQARVVRNDAVQGAQAMAGGAASAVSAGTAAAGTALAGAGGALSSAASNIGERISPDSELGNLLKSEGDQPVVISGETANLGKRFVAKVIDSFIIGIPFMIIGFVIGMIFKGNNLGQLLSGVLQLLNIAAFLLYNFFFLKKSGQTVGKKLLGLKVVDSNSQCPPQEIPLKRSLWELVPFGHLLCLFNKERQGLHDKMTGSRVIEAS